MPTATFDSQTSTATLGSNLEGEAILATSQTIISPNACRNLAMVVKRPQAIQTTGDSLELDDLMD
jgi:hypothetical protein